MRIVSMGHSAWGFCSSRVLLALIAVGAMGIAAPATAAKPNIVFIISDDLGGQSRVALMSGMYAQAIGVTSNGASGRFARNFGARPSMAQHFKQHGYHTARVSKIYHMRVPGDITAGVNGPDHAASWSERHNCKAPEQWSIGKHEHLTRERLKPDPQRSIHYRLGYGGAFYGPRRKRSRFSNSGPKIASRSSWPSAWCGRMCRWSRRLRANRDCGVAYSSGCFSPLG